MTTTADAYTRAIIADTVWTCLKCKRPLPPDRGGHCNDCVNWPIGDPQNDVCWSCGDQLDVPTYGPSLCPGCQEVGERWPEIKPTLQAALDVPGETPGVDQTDPSAPVDPDPAPGRCPYCNDRGPCWECGALDLSALGRKLRHEMRDDRDALLRRLRATPRRFWRVIAHAYALEIGGTPWVNTQPTIPGILWLWTTLERESA